MMLTFLHNKIPGQTGKLSRSLTKYWIILKKWKKDKVIALFILDYIFVLSNLNSSFKAVTLLKANNIFPISIIVELYFDLV